MSPRGDVELKYSRSSDTAAQHLEHCARNTGRHDDKGSAGDPVEAHLPLADTSGVIPRLRFALLALDMVLLELVTAYQRMQLSLLVWFGRVPSRCGPFPVDIGRLQAPAPPGLTI